MLISYGITPSACQWLEKVIGIDPPRSQSCWNSLWDDVTGVNKIRPTVWCIYKSSIENNCTLIKMCRTLVTALSCKVFIASLKCAWLAIYGYCPTSNVSRTLVGNEIVDHWDVVGASPPPTPHNPHHLCPVPCKLSNACMSWGHISPPHFHLYSNSMEKITLLLSNLQ